MESGTISDEDIFDDDASMESTSEDGTPAEEEDEEEEEELTTDEESDDETAVENVWHDSFVSDVFHAFQEDLEDRVTELEEDDMPTQKARETTLAEFLPVLNNALQKRVMKFCRVNHELKKDPTFMKIMATAKLARQEDDMDWEESIAYALGKRRFLLDKVLRSWDPPFEEDVESEDSDSA